MANTNVVALELNETAEVLKTGTVAEIIDLKSRKAESEISGASQLFKDAKNAILDNDVYIKKAQIGASVPAKDALKKSVFMAIYFIDNPKESELFYQTILSNIDANDASDKKKLKTLKSTRAKISYFFPIKYVFFSAGMVLDNPNVKWDMAAYSCITEWIVSHNKRTHNHPELQITEQNFDDWFVDTEVGKGSVYKWYAYAREKTKEPKTPKKKQDPKSPPATPSTKSNVVAVRNLGVLVYDADQHGELILNLLKSADSKDDAHDSLYAELVHIGTITESILDTIQDATFADDDI